MGVPGMVRGPPTSPSAGRGGIPPRERRRTTTKRRAPGWESVSPALADRVTTAEMEPKQVPEESPTASAVLESPAGAARLRAMPRRAWAEVGRPPRAAAARRRRRCAPGSRGRGEGRRFRFRSSGRCPASQRDRAGGAARHHRRGREIGSIRPSLALRIAGSGAAVDPVDSATDERWEKSFVARRWRFARGGAATYASPDVRSQTPDGSRGLA